MSSDRISNQSLQWTRPLLDELFEEVRQAVERFGDEEIEHQGSDLDQAIEACAKVAGSLAVMEFNSGQLIAEAMGVALEALKRGETRDEPDAIAKVLEATAILPDYLDYLESTRVDAPVIVLPTINDLRAIAGQQPLEESTFFRPDIDHAALPEPSNNVDAAGLRRDYQHALRGFLVNHQDAEALDTLGAVALKMRDAGNLSVAARRTGWAAAAVCEAMKLHQIAGGPSITRLFARTDVMLKECAERPNDEAVHNKADDLTRGFLFQIVLARAETPEAQAVHKAFDLNAHAPDQLAQAKVFLAGRNRALFVAVTKAAREDLAKIKEVLGSQLEQNSDPEVLQQQTALLDSVGESLSMLGLEHLAARVKAQAGKLADLGSDPDDPTLLMVARELLVVESQLEESFGLAAELGAADDDAGDPDTSLMPPSERRRIVKQLIKEALEDLAHAKHLLDAVNRQKADADAVGEAQFILARIAGALFVANLDQAAEMIDAAARLAGDHMSDGPDKSSSEALEALAETLTVTEFYLESLTTLDERGERYLQSARERLEKLGYLGEQAETGRDDASFEEAQAADELDELSDLEALQTDEPGSTEAVEREEYGADGDDELILDEDELEFDEFDDSSITAEQSGSDSDDVTLSADDEAEDSEFETSEVSAGSDDFDSTSAFDDFDIVEIFLEEFDQELEALREIVPQWQDNPSDEESTVTIRRAFHSLKGSGRMAGATEIGEFAWNIESLLNRIIDGQVQSTPEITGLIAHAVEALPSMRARLSGEGGQDMDEQSCAELANKAAQVAEGKLEPAGETPSTTSEASELEGLDPTLIDLMIKELSENLDTLERWLGESNESGHTPNINESMVRVVHTMKGTMRLAPIGDEAETAQILEAYLEELSLCSAPPTSEGLSVMSRCAQLFRHRLNRLCGEPVDQALFDSSELAGELRDLHNQAHRERTGEHAPHSLPPSDLETLSGIDEPAFSSEADAETEPTDSDFDFFDVEDDQVVADSDIPAEKSEGDEAAEKEGGLDQGSHVELDQEAREIEEEIEEQTKAGDSYEESDEELAEVEAEASAESNTNAEDDLMPGEVDEDEVQLESSDQDEAAEVAPEQESTDVPVSTFVPDRPAPEESVPSVKVDDNLIDIDYSEVNEDLLEAFLEEGQELLEHSDEVLQKWRETPDDKSLVTALQRDLHTIKGSSRMVGLNPIGQVAHVMEELLEGIAAGLKDPTTERIDALETGCDHLHLMIDAVNERKPVPMRPVEDLFADQADELDDEVVLPELSTELEQDRAGAEDTREARTENLRVPSTLIDELVNYAGEISIFRSRLEQQISVFRNNVGEVDETVIRLRDQLRKLEIETEAQILARFEREHGPTDEAFDPLELDRYSTIQQLSRALAESVNDLTSLTGILDDATRQSETLLMQQSRVNTELQEGLMQARMVSFNTLLPRFRRVIRNASREVGKKAQLRVDLAGENELDRNVLERITAPLEHLLRNAISHGIEAPDQRRQLGKPETGTISIDVSREATELVMRIADDGAGIDIDAIRQRGIERGLIDKSANPNDAELIQMIFRSGFSTAKQVSELAGRGIGMDVVANEVRQIGGSVSAHAERGKGTEFVIRIPLSLTVMQAIMVRASDRQFAIPLQSVRGVTRILADEWLREIESTEPVQEYAGDQYPLLELEPQLDFAAEEVGSGTLSLLMVEAGQQRAALRVSELLGHREIVIKPVGPQISSIPGILGGTITGDGQVVSILDIGPLIRNAFARDLLPGRGDILEADRGQEVKRTPLVMVVDDSITMRRVTSRVLEHRGLEVVTARDGLDAVEAMFDRVPDLILLDIEMPRMDGYELATHVRNDPRLKAVPMMMITSRSGEKHRQRAREVGVDDYLPKPYQEAELVEHVFELLKMNAPEG